MMKMDLLAELYNGVVTPDDADSLLTAILESRAPNIKEILGFSDIEYTAYAHGVALAQLAKWRYDGWPQNCARCGRFLRIEDYGWWAKKEQENYSIYHIDCLRK